MFKKSAWLVLRYEMSSHSRHHTKGFTSLHFKLLFSETAHAVHTPHYMVKFEHDGQPSVSCYRYYIALMITLTFLYCITDIY